jgi:hypothetical protein
MIKNRQRGSMGRERFQDSDFRPEEYGQNIGSDPGSGWSAENMFEDEDDGGSVHPRAYKGALRLPATGADGIFPASS